MSLIIIRKEGSGNMKNKLLKKKRSNLFKRTVCLILSATILITDSYVFNILDDIGLNFYQVVYAEETVNINTISELVQYSKDYSAAHAKDTLNISIASGGTGTYQTSETQYSYDEFISIGSSASDAFEGTVNITVLASSYFNFTKPLFGYIKDSTQITVNGGSSNGYLELRRPYTSNQLPVFAENVIHETNTENYDPADESEYTNWKIRINYFHEEGEASIYQDFPSVIGRIDDNCKLGLDIINDAQNGDDRANILSGSSNAGLICGTLGDSATVKVSIGGSNTSFNVTSSSGNAGTLIGEMESGAKLILNGSNISGGTGRTITASNGYAGGLVGKATDAEIEFDSSFTINEKINGKNGAGGIAGYYKSSTSQTFDFNDSSIDCTLVSTASAGGLFGVLETTGVFTIDGTAKSYSIASTSNTTGDASYYGGLIGSYKTSNLANTLDIRDLTVTTKGGGKNPAGLIGKIDNSSAAYVNVSDVTVSNSNTSGLCGIVQNAGTAGHFLNVGTFTLNGSSGAGLVGTMNAGVIRLTGTTTMSAAAASAQLVKSRGNTLIYALGSGSDAGWTFNRCPSVAVDDIGNWGEVVRLTSANEYTGTDDSDTSADADGLIVTYDSSAHTVTVASPVKTMDSVTDVIKTALNMQINRGDRGSLQFDDDTNNSAALLSDTNLQISGTIDLSGTGIIGLMRDDGQKTTFSGNTSTDAADAFTGSITGVNSGKVILAIGEPYGMRGNSVLTSNGNGNGNIHTHTHPSFLAVTNGATITNLAIGGTVYVNSGTDGVYIGGFVGQSKGNLSMTGISEDVYITGKSTVADKKKYVGGIIGKVEGDGSAVSISGTNNSVIDINGYTCIYASNSIGYVGDNTVAISFNNYTLGSTTGTATAASLTNNSGSPTNANGGGLIGFINGTSNQKTVNINNSAIAKYNLTLSSSVSAGGLLGSEWNNAEVNFGNTGTTGVVISDCVVNQSTESAAGLVHSASGHWAVSKLKMQDTTLNLTGVTNYGVLVNKGYSLNDDADTVTAALFMELKSTSGSGNGFDLSDDVTVTGSSLSVYDELVAYSSFNSSVLDNGNSVVSIHTPSGTVVGGKYANQITVADALKNNPYSRYYYDLDVIRAAVTSGTYPSGSTVAEQNAYKLMMWNLKQYAHSTIQSYFTSANNAAEPLTGDFDLSKVSYYPVDRNNSALSIGAASFTFNNKNIENSAVAGTSYRSTMNSGSQHYLMHSGLLRNVKSNISITNDITLSGCIGSHEGGSGAIINGTLGGLTEGTTSFSNTSEKLITLNGLTVNSTATYKPVLINKISNHVLLTLNGVNTAADSYKNGSSVNMAGSSLIGIVGTKDGDGKATSDSISLTFNDIRLDSRTDTNKGVAALSAFDTAYGTTQGVFTRATLLEEFIFNNNSDCKGVYNYRLSEDWNSSTEAAIHHVTYGKEITETEEFEGMQDHYVDLLGKTNPESYDNTQDEDIDYSFANFLPYVAVLDYDEAVDTKRSREIMVNHTNVSITHGCGTYNDPYIIDTNGQIEVIAKILELGEVSDGFTINVPKCTNASTADYKGWCGDDHIKLTFKNGTYTASNTTYNHTTAQLAKYLAGAYYKITKIEKTEGEGESATTTYESIIINSTSFNGLGGTSDAYAFHGVIVGDSTDMATYPLVNNTGSPLIKTSYGSVVKDVTINVRNENISRSQNDNTQKFVIGGGCSNYGAVMGQILGGDNIIDNVSVDFTGSTIKVEGSSAKIIPVGGYVGVVASGALIFRGMSSNADHDGLPSGIVKNGTTDIAMNSTDWLYVNPIVGRVLNGYAVYEADVNANSNDYKYSESTVTMKNGTKNYSIADIDPDLDKVEVSAYTKKGSTNYYTTNVTVPNAQSMFVLSMLMQSRTIGNDKYGTDLKVLNSDSYDKDKKQAMHHARYDKVGTSDNSDYNTYAIYDTVGVADVNGIKYSPYLVERYTSAVSAKYYVLSLTNAKTVCNMTLTASETPWYLPDGFKGIGYIGYDKSTSDGISLHKFNGNGNTIHLNMSLNHYSTSVDNYLPSSGNVGFGLFSSIRHNDQNQGGAVSDENLATDNYKIKNLNLTGTIDYDVPDITVYSSTNVETTSGCIDVGGFAGYCGYGEANDLRIEGIDLSGLTVNGFKTAGGLFGYLNMAKNTSYLAKITYITAETGTLTVTSKQYVGGIVGRAEQIGLTIEGMSISNLSVLTDNDGTNYDNGVGGVIGRIKNNDGNSTYSPVTLDDITIGDENATTNLRFGYRVDAPLHDTSSNTYYRIATGGLIGHSLMNNNKTPSGYGLIVSNCYVYNVDLYGHRVGGILGHDSNGESTASASNIMFSNDHVISSNNATITGVIYNNNTGLNKNNNTDRGNVQNRGCGGIAGFIKNGKYKVLFENCSVEGYTLLSYNDTGGLCSNISDDGLITLNNITLKDLTISSCYHGALFGYLKKPTNGYNILTQNITLQKFYNNNYIDGKYGYYVGNNDSKDIKLVGVTRQGTLDVDHKDRIVGKKETSNVNSVMRNYGTNGYIIWADTLGKCTATATAGTKQSDLTDTTTVEAKSPWVTVSPSINISGTGASSTQVLTGDSIMANFRAADTLSNYNNVDTAGVISTLADVNTTAKNDYMNFRGGANGETQLFSTYETEMGDGSLPEGVDDFAVIAVDNNGAKVTEAVNSYVQLLTHTTDNYAKTDKSNVYKVKIYRCTYNETTKTFERGSSDGLTRISSGFLPDVDHPDTAADTACFTLVDVQFLNPNNANEVAYHVYVPVLIKKLLKFSFKASSMPGTVYDYTNYVYKTSSHTSEDKWGTPSVTNLGTPVTMYFRYDYISNVSEWQEMINNGESLMWHPNNKLLLKTAASNLPANTRMVLVDPNDNDRAYFTKANETGVFTKNTNSSQNDYYIDLTKFKNGTDTFASMNFGERLSVTASTSSSSTATKAYVVSAEGESVYVKAKINGTGDKIGFRPATDADSSKTKYYLTVDGTSSFPPAGISDSYYITFFTDTANDPLRVIIGGSASSLTSSPQTSEISNHTLKCTTQTESALILGNIFKQEFTKFETENAQSGLVNTGCDYFESDIIVKISVNNDSGEADTIISYLNNDSIQVYHSVLLGLTKNDGTIVENTIYGTPTYTVNKSKVASGIYGTISSTLSGSSVSTSGYSITTPTNTTSFIQIGDLDYDIKPLLVEKIGSLYGGAIVTISGLRTHFDYLNIPNQFPYQPSTVQGQNTVGTTVKAISTLDSDATNIAYSSIRIEKSDTNAVKYHSETPSSASLVYVVDTSDDTDLVTTYNMLGINPIDEPEYRNNIIIADGTYNAVSFVDSAQASKIRWMLTLEKKNESGIYETVKMSDYVSGNVSVTNRASGSVFTPHGNSYIFDEDYTTPMDITKLTTVYAIKTGTDLESLKDAENNPVSGVYANYKVTLSATLYTGSEPLDGELSSRKVDNSTVSDFIKYTNAKVKAGWINN